MLGKYEDLIICDLAQYYHIYDYEQFEPSYIATLVSNLEGSSRLKRELAGKYTEQEIILARINDLLSLIWWSKTTDGEKNRNRPELLSTKMLGIEEKEKQDSTHDVFNSKEEFWSAREKALKRI